MRSLTTIHNPDLALLALTGYSGRYRQESVARYAGDAVVTNGKAALVLIGRADLAEIDAEPYLVEALAPGGVLAPRDLAAAPGPWGWLPEHSAPAYCPTCQGNPPRCVECGGNGLCRNCDEGACPDCRGQRQTCFECEGTWSDRSRLQWRGATRRVRLTGPGGTLDVDAARLAGDLSHVGLPTHALVDTEAEALYLSGEGWRYALMGLVRDAWESDVREHVALAGPEEGA